MNKFSSLIGLEPSGGMSFEVKLIGSFQSGSIGLKFLGGALGLSKGLKGLSNLSATSLNKLELCFLLIFG